MEAFIYKITNIVNGKTYVGFTSKSIERRFIEHKSDARKCANNMPLGRSIRKYGEENFIIEELERGDAKYLLSERETYWIDKIHPDYNVTMGGEGMLGYKHTPESIEKIRKVHIGRKESEKSKRSRAQKIKEGYSKQTYEEKIRNANTSLNSNTQRMECEVEGIKFRSINEMARWVNEKYGISINTAIRYYKEGIPFSHKKYNRKYYGRRGTKYL